MCLWAHQGSNLGPTDYESEKAKLPKRKQ